ncbi:hypothetical protein GGR54DRAFT_459140 [Hypoxylon sp. NC1633]|nr:hypothetical protein GGR54DRAFT_459140 [Hypoxylon sp. NC1633]
MSRPARIDLNKRRPPNDTTTAPSPKKRKLRHPTRPPPAFWDNLSEIPLTSSALRELDRRNVAASSPRTSRRPTPQRTTHTSIQPAAQFLSSSSRTELKKIQTFAKQGGPDLSGLRESTLTPQTISTKKTSPYDLAFQQHLIDHGIYPNGYEYPDGTTPPQPDNLDDIHHILARPRASLSPSRFSNEDFGKFKRANTRALKEWQVMSKVVPTIRGDDGDSNCAASQTSFTNLNHLTDGSLVPGSPDLYYGARPEQLDRRVRTELSGHIIPSTQQDLPIAPNFFLHVKGPDGHLAVAERQALYDGVLGARGIRSLQTYGDTKSGPDNKAYTVTGTYHGGTLDMYTIHPLPPASPEGRCEYAMTLVNSWSMKGNASQFRQGAAAYRNARDWATQMRDEAINKANKAKLKQHDGKP